MKPTDYTFFREAKDFPWNPKSKDYEPVTAWWLAELSLLSYLPDQLVFRNLWRAGIGWPCEPFYIGDCRGVIFHTGEKDRIVAFRGTDTHDSLRTAIEDFDSDADFIQKPIADVYFFESVMPVGQIKIHEGFNKRLDAAWNAIVGSIKGCRVWFTGHSMGGALATIATYRGGRNFNEDCIPQGLYTVGSPRVGNQAFVDSVNCAIYPGPNFRIIDGIDAVPNLPPAKTKFCEYAHVGTPIHIAKPGYSTIGKFRAWLLREFKSIEAPLGNHSPILYADNLHTLRGTK